MNKFQKALEKRKEEERRRREAERAARESDAFLARGKDGVSGDKPAPAIETPNFSRCIKHADVDKTIVALHEPRSSVAEQYRTLRTNLKSYDEKRKLKTFVISSSEAGEGKTVTAINLAYSFAHDKTKKVLLVDADLRRSKVAAYLGLKEEIAGFSEVLEGCVTFQEARVNTELDNLHVLLGHTYGSAENASELLDSKEMGRCLDLWKTEYDYIILDSPPILPVTDAAVIGRRVDGVLLVFKAGKTQKNTIKHAQQLFEQAGVNLLGYIMTHVEALAPGRRDYYYSYYRY